MSGFFSNSRISDAITTGADIVILNLLWLIFSLPIVTIGASTTAMYRVSVKLVRGEGNLFKTFLGAFKQNFRQATVIWLIIVVLFAMFYFDIRIMKLISSPLGQVGVIFFGSAAILGICVIQYVFPLLAWFENSVLQTLRNAAIMSIRHAPVTLMMTGIWLLPFAAWLFIPSWFFYYGFHFVLFSFALVSYAKAHLLNSVFSKYS